MASIGLNQVILVGNLGRDVELRYTANQKAIGSLRVATNKSWKDKDSGEQKTATEWHTVVMFGRRAESLAEQCRKGALLYVRGELRTRKWQDKEGKDRYTTEVVADEIRPIAGAESSIAQTEAAQAGEPAQDFDDDIPF